MLVRVSFTLVAGSCPLMAGPHPGLPVLMISIDGMKPDYVSQAAAERPRLPYLRGMALRGAHATGVTGVWPTVTYPSHTTLITGVAPAAHGIYNNLEFDPRRNFGDSWYWYASQIRVPTLWQAAHRAGLTTASVGWPVSVGSPDVDFLIPEYWRIFKPTEDLNPSDRDLIAALSRPAGILESMQRTLGPYLMGNDVSVEADEIKTRYSVDILLRHHPRFMSVHLSSLDEAQHDHGPFSEAANRTLEAIDAMVARLAAAARSREPGAIVMVVSDHGFVELTHRVNLYIPFIRAGLLDVDVDPDSRVPRIKSWRAQPWVAGGMAAVMLRDPGDAATLTEVRALLAALAADPANGIDAVLDSEAARQRGAFPGASFVVVMQPSFAVGAALGAEPVSPVVGRGGHGFSPEVPSMRAAFFVDGAGIAAGRDLGIVDMRRIAPTVAMLLRVALPNAEAPLPVRQ